MKKIFLIAGHNGAGTGANGYLDEGAETIKLRDMIDAELCKLGVIPETDFNMENEKLTNVVKWLKGAVDKTDLCIDIHFNAAGETANGTEVLIPENHSENELELANKICLAICDALGTRNRGVKTENQSAHGKLAMLSGFDCEQILLEICFCSNKDDTDKYMAKRSELAEQLALLISKS